ncbi:MAG: uracil-DNA glycosylase family protein, partial [Limnobacter sp.]|nr:uracil-DNA glycosylase family protein [Limnobacter sp.]
NAFFQNELTQYKPKVLMALGLVAHQAVLKALGLKLSAYKFAHGAEHDLGEFTLIDSYHVSRYNTQTGRLTTPMFEAVVRRVRQLLD